MTVRVSVLQPEFYRVFSSLFLKGGEKRRYTLDVDHMPNTLGKLSSCALFFGGRGRG